MLWKRSKGLYDNVDVSHVDLIVSVHVSEKVDSYHTISIEVVSCIEFVGNRSGLGSYFVIVARLRSRCVPSEN